MRRALVLALSAAALAAPVAAPPASAAAESRATGWCSYELVGAREATGGGFTGYLVGTFVLSSAAAGDNPVSADVTCELYERGVLLAAFTASGTGVVVGSTPITLTHDFEPGYFDLCEIVDFTSDATPTTSWCGHGDVAGPIAQPLVDAADEAVSQVPGGRDAVCAALRALGPVGLSTYRLDRQGNVSLPTVAYWRCTPWTAA